MAERTEREVLNQLIETCRDGEMGFRIAAEHVSDPALRRQLVSMAEERARYADELLPHAQRLGGAWATDGTNMGALHRRWIGFKSVIRHDDHSVLVEVARGDRATVNVYKEAIEGILPPDTRDIVERQYATVQQEHNQLAAVEHGNRVH